MDKSKEKKDIEVECGGTWKKVVPANTYDKDGKSRHKLESGDYGTDDLGEIPDENSPVGNNIDLEQ